MSVSSTPNPTDALLDILNSSDTSDWTLQKPQIKRHDTTTPQERENTSTDTVYVREGAGITITRFSADPETVTEDGTPACLVYSLDEDASRTHARDIFEIVRAYMNDNFDELNLYDIEPTSLNDYRAQSISRQTDHFVFGVEFETHRFTA